MTGILDYNKGIYSTQGFRNSLLNRNLPLPVNETLTIQITDSKMYEISIYDLQGRVVLEKQIFSNINTLSTLAWNNGIYQVKITDFEGKSINKVLVKISK